MLGGRLWHSTDTSSLTPGAHRSDLNHTITSQRKLPPPLSKREKKKVIFAQKSFSPATSCQFPRALCARARLTGLIKESHEWCHIIHLCQDKLFACETSLTPPPPLVSRMCLPFGPRFLWDHALMMTLGPSLIVMFVGLAETIIPLLWTISIWRVQELCSVDISWLVW